MNHTTNQVQQITNHVKAQGVMDYDNPHLWGKCQCECHQLLEGAK